MTRDAPNPEGSSSFIRRAAAPAALLVVALAVVLYVMHAPRGKEGAGEAACPGTAAKAARLEPLIHGEIAALSVAKPPKPLPVLKFASADGKPVELADFKGRQVLFNLWASWCAPCRKEMPALDHLQASLGDKDFTVVAVNIDTAKLDRAKTFLTETGIRNLAFYSDNTAEVFQTLKRAGNVLGLPTTILVDGNGCEIATMAGPAQWDSDEALALIKAARS